MKFQSVKEKQALAFDTLKAKFGYVNKMQSPKITKVVIYSGVGSAKDKKKLAIVADRLAKITGQKASARAAKISIASFRLREGEVVGYQVTLRGQRMFDFLDKLLNIALPRTRDFRGLSPKSVDEMGNYTIGIKENTIFPESTDEELKDVFGFSITVVTTSNDKKQTRAFLDLLGFPIKKEEAKKK